MRYSKQIVTENIGHIVANRRSDALNIVERDFQKTVSIFKRKITLWS
jgi:hypothetical protein